MSLKRLVVYIAVLQTMIVVFMGQIYVTPPSFHLSSSIGGGVGDAGPALHIRVNPAGASDMCFPLRNR